MTLNKELPLTMVWVGLPALWMMLTREKKAVALEENARPFIPRLRFFFFFLKWRSVRAH